MLLEFLNDTRNIISFFNKKGLTNFSMGAILCSYSKGAVDVISVTALAFFHFCKSEWPILLIKG